MDQARHFLTHFTGPTGYSVFFLIITSCCIGMPFNSDFMFITAGVLASLGYFQLWILLVLGYLALLLGDSINFFVARRYGKKLLKIKPFSWVLSEAKVTQAEQYLARNGTQFLFMVRFLPLIRTVLFFSAGALQVKPKTFYLMNALATLIYLPILMGSAYLASEHIDELVRILKQFQFGLLGLVVFIALLFAFRKKEKKELAS